MQAFDFICAFAFAALFTSAVLTCLATESSAFRMATIVASKLSSGIPPVLQHLFQKRCLGQLCFAQRAAVPFFFASQTDSISFMFVVPLRLTESWLRKRSLAHRTAVGFLFFRLYFAFRTHSISVVSVVPLRLTKSCLRKRCLAHRTA